LEHLECVLFWRPSPHDIGSRYPSPHPSLAETSRRAPAVPFNGLIFSRGVCVSMRRDAALCGLALTWRRQCAAALFWAGRPPPRLASSCASSLSIFRHGDLRMCNGRCCVDRWLRPDGFGPTASANALRPRTSCAVRDQSGCGTGTVLGWRLASVAAAGGGSPRSMSGEHAAVVRARTRWSSLQPRLAPAVPVLGLGEQEGRREYEIDCADERL